MAIATKVLAQSTPAVTTLTDIYTVPSSTKTTVTTFTVANRGATATTFRLSVAVAGAADHVKQYIYYDIQIAAYDSFASTIGMTLATTDVVRVYTPSSDLSFNLFGIEES